VARLRARLRDLSDCRQFEHAARVSDRLAALETIVRGVRRLERLRAARLCYLVPALEPGFVCARFVAGGRIAATRTLPPGGGAHLEIQAGLAAARAVAEPSLEPEDADVLLLLDGFLRRPPPELVVTRPELRAILTAAERVTRTSAAGYRTH
jgi:hypothetical protein